MGRYDLAPQRSAAVEKSKVIPVCKILVTIHGEFIFPLRHIRSTSLNRRTW
jgi:hypothetical protein